MENMLVGLVGPHDARLLRPVLREHHGHLVANSDRLPWLAAPAAAADDAYEILAANVDTADDAGDVPWCHAIVQLLESPRIGSRLARRWFTALYRARWEDREVSTVQEAVAAYAVTAYEVLLGRSHEAQWWARTAAIVTEADERGGLGLIVLVRAARLLQPLLQRWPPSSP